MDIVRKAETDDSSELLRLYRQLSPADILPDEKTCGTVIASLRDNPMTNLLVVERFGGLIATCVLTVIPNITRGGRPYGLIENVVSDERCRRQGVGRRLMEAAAGIARGQGCYKIMLMSGISRPEAHEFYESIGFDGSTKRAFEMRFE
jgi:GNAT superfamily N-acetyltransferase